jgi:dipeptidyl aminopeptidase/acylaminoacyl peptidase
LLNPEKLEKPKSSAREYESASVRFWDTYVTRYSSTLWYTVLEHVDGKYKLSKSEPVNALAGTEIHFPSTPTSELHSGGSYEIASTGLLLTTEDPEIDPAENDVQGLWYIKLKSFIETKPHVQQIYNSDKAYKGSIGGATFSFDGKYIAYMQQRAWKYPDREAEVFMTHLDSLEESYAVPCKNEEGTVLEPQSLMFSNDGTELYVLAQYKARAVLFTKQINGREDSFSEGMKQLPLGDSIAGISRFNSSVNDQRLFITTTSYTNPSVYVVSHPPSMAPALVISDQFEQGSLLGLKSDQVQEIHVKQTDKDGNDYDVQSWVVVPSDFDPSKKYPLLMLIHGGPLGAWTNTWSTRWNPAVFSEQGYVVVNPNPTGSTSFGWNLTKGIFGEWGGACYTDLEATFSYVEANMPFVDTKNAVLGGGSFGGYMTNWVAGQKLGAKMKALFSHDGIFTMTNMLSSDVPWMLDLDVGKHLWEDTELWNKYSPSSFTQVSLASEEEKTRKAMANTITELEHTNAGHTLRQRLPLSDHRRSRHIQRLQATRRSCSILELSRREPLRPEERELFAVVS